MKLKSKQEEVFEVEKEVACRSITVKNMVDDTGLDAPVPLPMVDSKILIKVIEYCKYHHKAEQAHASPLPPSSAAARPALGPLVPAPPSLAAPSSSAFVPPPPP